MRFDFIVIAAILMSSGVAMAGEANVTKVSASPLGGTKWRFDVTVRHDDAGWDHFANRWEVVAPDGTVLGTRVLAHPHVNEQPFTRSGGVDIPTDISEVIVRANDSVHGLGGAEVVFKIPR